MTGGASPFVVPAPDAAALVRWPADFGRRFAIFVDVEEEFDWSAPLSSAARSVETIAALPAMAERFAERGIRATYMLDHPIATDPRAVDTIRSMLVASGGAVGTQLHAWVNPPHDETVTSANSFAGNLPRSLEAAKLDTLTAAITAAFGRSPTAYRAGRYGLGPNSLALLAELGYRLDTSMRARFDYRVDGGPDFRAVGNHAFHTGPDRTIVELPLTTVFTGRLSNHGAWLHPRLGAIPHARGVAARAGLLSRVPLTPEGTPVDEATEAIRKAADDGVQVLNLAFHSPSLVPGHTPYVRDATDLARFHAWWDAVFAVFDRLAIRPATLDDLLGAT